MSQVERMVYLRSIDMMWIEHLNAMELLRQGIGLRGYGQRDPLVEYKGEAYRLFGMLNQSINNQVVDILLKADIRPAPVQTAATAPMRSMRMQGADETLAAGTFEGAPNAPGGGALAQEPTAQTPEPLRQTSSGGGVEVTVRKKGEGSTSGTSVSSVPKVGRNEPCPCGSGKKYKKCHGR